ncbi:MAG: zf-HC2 domain-containing protein [Chloroflexi bacterium]|nr:zf-HC2 domain-containing protein [Chloroflexota bacterium]
MNHRPFEDWLLDDQPLTLEQERELQAHLRSCPACSAIAESNLALHSVRTVSPAAGFTERFQTRLVQRRQEQRWRQIIGTLILVLGGLALLAWLAGPAIQEVLQSPAQWLTTAVSYFLFILTSIQALSEAGSVLMRVIPNFISPADWLGMFLMIVVIGGLWVVSIWRVTRVPQGV